ncbi:hypothetical protein ACG2LH_02915 [Zhouia sp. PK063]|uniref:hypothetical protein n=1 Tax=Zhouia sp. PK063 TaxID=3373602 RepID=UPI0037A3D05A
MKTLKNGLIAFSMLLCFSGFPQGIHINSSGRQANGLSPKTCPNGHSEDSNGACDNPQFKYHCNGCCYKEGSIPAECNILPITQYLNYLFIIGILGGCYFIGFKKSSSEEHTAL